MKKKIEKEKLDDLKKELWNLLRERESILGTMLKKDKEENFLDLSMLMEILGNHVVIGGLSRILLEAEITNDWNEAYLLEQKKFVLGVMTREKEIFKTGMKKMSVTR